MKTCLNILVLIAATVAESSHAATTLLADQYIGAGSGNAFGTSPYSGTVSGMFAAGTDNLIGRNGSGAFGSDNEVGAHGGLAVGLGNDVGVQYYDSTYGSAAFGQSNRVFGSFCVTVGALNDLMTDFELGGGESSLVIGTWNYNIGQDSLVAGMNNQLWSYDQAGVYKVPSCAALLGRGLISYHSDCAVVGRNNTYTLPTNPPLPTAPLFVVGNGASASQRSNAFEVRGNGDIIITKPQGDISMGIYGD